MKTFLSNLTNEQQISDFHHKIEENRKYNDSYIQTIVEYCEENDLEIEEIIPLISSTLKQKISEERSEISLNDFVF